MKKIKYLLPILFICQFAFSQSTVIEPGTILPKVSTVQRTSITSPNGVLVFDTDTQSYWFRANGIWEEVSNGSSSTSFWELNGTNENEIKNTNAGGFWSAHSHYVHPFDFGSVPLTAPTSGTGTRLMWIPSLSAFRAGTVYNAGANYWNASNMGMYSFATGVNTLATGLGSTALGSFTQSTGNSTTAMGEGTTASGWYATAMGYETIASGQSSTAMGRNTEATGIGSTALGELTDAIGVNSTAMGSSTIASGNNSTAMGGSTVASEVNSTAMGGSTEASGANSTAMGELTEASGVSSTAMGKSTVAEGDYSTAMGELTYASGKGSIAMGFSSYVSGDYSTAIGYESDVFGSYSLASGYYATAYGNNSTAMGNYADAGGDNSTAMGNYCSTGAFGGSFVIGDNSTTTNLVSTAINQYSSRFAGGYRLFSDAGTTMGVQLAAGANSWTTISDSTKKENFLVANGEDVLTSISKMRVGTWNYKSQNPEKFRHWGVMAQDFYLNFGKDKFGTIGTDTSIATADFDGVSFAALKALEARTKEQKLLIEHQNKEISKLKSTLSEYATLSARLERLEANEKNYSSK